MTVVPAAIPVAIPLTEPIVAIPVAELLQIPPDTVLVNPAVAPTFTVDAPDKVPGKGSAFTVIIFVAFAVPQLLDIA
jgi:hypothetical protein